MKKLLTVVAVTLMASGIAMGQALPVGFINDDGTIVSGDPITPSAGTATFVRIQNNSASTINLTVVMADSAGTPFHSNTGTLTAGNFFAWRPRFFQGILPSGTGATANGVMTVLHDGAAGDLGGNVVSISRDGSRLAYLVLEQI